MHQNNLKYIKKIIFNKKKLNKNKKVKFSNNAAVQDTNGGKKYLTLPVNAGEVASLMSKVK